MSMFSLVLNCPSNLGEGAAIQLGAWLWECEEAI